MSARASCKLCSWMSTQTMNDELGLAVSVDDRFPVSPGHVLIMVRRHEPDFFALSEEERADIWSLVARERGRLATRLGTDDFNVGLNAGVHAGQTVAHAHVHLIPRFPGDVPDPRGGVRGVVPPKRLY